jgi:hypothetical protein
MADLSGSRFKVELILEKLNTDYKMRAPGQGSPGGHSIF